MVTILTDSCVQKEEFNKYLNMEIENLVQQEKKGIWILGKVRHSCNFYQLLFVFP